MIKIAADIAKLRESLSQASSFEESSRVVTAFLERWLVGANVSIRDVSTSSSNGNHNENKTRDDVIPLVVNASGTWLGQEKLELPLLIANVNRSMVDGRVLELLSLHGCKAIALIPVFVK